MNAEQAPNSPHIAVVGASLAGWRAAEQLRRSEFGGTITLIGDEPHQPYDRPPLSKQVLAGDWPAERTVLAPEDQLRELDLTARFGTRAIGLNLADRTLTLAPAPPAGADQGDYELGDHDTEELGFDGLIIATGARCRALPTGGLSGIHTLRTLDDAMAITEAFDAHPSRVAVVGAGFIGAEVAATARGRGLEVTMIEALPIPLGRVLGEDIGQLCAELHREHGVDLRLGVGVEHFVGGPEDRVTGVVLTDGSTVDADVVVVGIGVIPNTEWLEGSGLELDNGVMCDETCLAAPGVVAVGDVACWRHVTFDEVMRVEHWENAVEQGKFGANRLLKWFETGDDSASSEPYAPVPWFWSDQYDRKLQLAGRIRSDDTSEIVTGSLEERRFATIFGRSGKLVGVFGMNRPRHVMQYRQLITEGATWDEALSFAKE